MTTARESPPDLDPVIHAQARLRVMTTLTTLDEGDRIAFSRLQELLEMTAGNLITHLRKLEEAGYITTRKYGSGRSTTTYVALTTVGHRAFDDYVAALQTLLAPTTEHPAPNDQPAPNGDGGHAVEGT